MITGEHSVIRLAEPDDAYELKRLYDPQRPHSAMLDRRREIAQPSIDELREGLAKPEKRVGALYAIEDKEGVVRGFCSIRGASAELRYAEMVMPLFEDSDYATPLADEAFAFLHRGAFVERRLNKVVAHCLDSEGAYRALLVRHGFASDGIQRQVLWSRGRWHDLETLTLFGCNLEQ